MIPLRRPGASSILLTRSSVVAILTAAVMALAACRVIPFDDSTQDKPHRTGGPLQSGGEGGAAVDPPSGGYQTYVATFGPMSLCSTTTAIPVLTRVDFGSEAPPGTYALVRTVSRELAARTPPRDRPDLAGLLFGLGSPPEFQEPYAGWPSPGDYSPDLNGFRVEQSCEENRDATVAVNRHRVPETGLADLMVVVPSTASGARVDGFTVEYSADDETYLLEVPWTMVVCDQNRKIPECGGAAR